MKLERIIVGVDFSPPSRQAASWMVKKFAPGAEITLVHTVEVPHVPRFLSAEVSDPEELRKTLREGATSRLRALEESLASERVTTEIREGRPHEQLAEVADAKKADLVVLGERGKFRGMWNIIGGTVERLLHFSSHPVLVAQNVPETQPTSVLLALNEDVHLDQILAWGRLLSRLHDTRLVVFNAAPNLYSAITGHAVHSEAEARELQTNLEEGSRKWLEGLVKTANLQSDRTSFVVRSGDPRYGILAAAQETAADVIVIGRHQGSALREALLGSVTRSVLQASATSVLIVGGISS
jgi:nucleotide-binding universal stress UspA family protein